MKPATVSDLLLIASVLLGFTTLVTWPLTHDLTLAVTVGLLAVVAFFASVHYWRKRLHT